MPRWPLSPVPNQWQTIVGPTGTTPNVTQLTETGAKLSRWRQPKHTSARRKMPRCGARYSAIRHAFRDAGPKNDAFEASHERELQWPCAALLANPCAEHAPRSGADRGKRCSASVTSRVNVVPRCYWRVGPRYLPQRNSSRTVVVSLGIRRDSSSRPESLANQLNKSEAPFEARSDETELRR